MDTKSAYNNWANQYDSGTNKTRDLEAAALQENLNTIDFRSCLEIGCGTGKNTEWLLTRADEILAIDLSPGMLAKARAKIAGQKVKFLQADLKKEWSFVDKKYDLAVFSLVLEHIENLDNVFENAAKSVKTGGYIYIGELHPFKQYSGTKARFETEEGIQVVDCYNHHLSDFTSAARNSGFEIANLNEYFDEDDRTSLPRILTILFRKSP